MDSTSLCFLAASATPNLLTFRWGEAEAGNDDAVFAAHAMRALAEAEHHVVAPHELPPLFADPHVPEGTEEPYPFARTAARTRHSARVLAQRGSRRHLAGHGGDELFTPLPGYLHHLLWRHPITAIRHVRGYAALKRWPTWSTLAKLARPGDVASWWRTQANWLTAPAPPRRRPVLGWGLWPLRAPDWATSAGIDLAQAALRRAAEQAQPLATDPGQHQTLLVLRTYAAHYRLLARLFSEAGTELDVPFFDDRVAEAVLTVRTHEHAGPWRYKPLLAEAMRGIVPDEIAGRSTKGEFSADIRIGLHRNTPSILESFADSALAEHGLINPDAVRTHLVTPQPTTTGAFALEALIGCETWLRTALQPTTPTRRTDAAPTAP